MADPYIKKSAGEIIKSEDWNTIQIKSREEIDTVRKEVEEARGRYDSLKIKLDKDKEEIHKDLKVDKLTVSGNVGIGTTSPGANLQIGSGGTEVAQNGLLVYRSAASNNYVAKFQTDHGDGAGGNLLEVANKTGSKFLINNAGNVGIGTTGPKGRLDVAGDIRAGNSDIYFTNTTHKYTGTGNANGYAAIENAEDHNALMILGRAGTPKGRYVKLWDYLQVNGGLEVTGNVGIGTTNPTKKLTVEGGSIRPAVGNSADAGIYFPTNPGGGGGDEAFIRYYVESGETTKLRIGINNDADDRLSLYQMGDDRLTIYNGNVGIGTTEPQDKLDIAGGLRVLTGSNPIRFTSEWSGFPDSGTNRAEISNDTAAYKALMIIGNKSAGTVRRVSVWDRLEVNGHLVVTGGKTGYVVDQFINKVGQPLEQGDVIVIGKNQASGYYGLDNNIPIPEVDFTDKAYDSRVCGIVAEVSMIEMTAEEEKKDTSKKKTKKEEVREEIDKTKVGVNQKGMMVTLGAYAHCKVDADIAPIEVGDLLTTSPTSGHAQKVLDKSMAIGAIIGKALAPLEKGKGKIPVMVLLQ